MLYDPARPAQGRIEEGFSPWLGVGLLVAAAVVTALLVNGFCFYYLYRRPTSDF